MIAPSQITFLGHTFELTGDDLMPWGLRRCEYKSVLLILRSRWTTVPFSTKRTFVFGLVQIISLSVIFSWTKLTAKC